MYDDTIAAISTPVGEGGIGIVRLSGPESPAIARRLFTRGLEDRRLVHGHIVDPASGDMVDEVLVSWMQAPHTYTREDLVEINCHGGPVALQEILRLVLAAGARLANPGEFTLRAFINGRIDLVQAESVLDVVQAKTRTGLQLALEGLAGHLSQPLRELRGQLIDALAHLTARIDFPEEDVSEQDIIPSLEAGLAATRGLISTADAGIVYRHGVRTAIAGRPNVGKSSLLNRLLRESRAIVTPTPGTTRDTVIETADIKGVPFVLIDTAGIMESGNEVECLAVERSKQAIDQADFVLFVVDCSEPLTQADSDLAASLDGKSVLLAVNKSDLPQQAELSALPPLGVRTSALTGEGIAELEEALVKAVLSGTVVPSKGPLVSNPRHKEALARAEKRLNLALESAVRGMPEDFISIDLTAAVDALGEITGETAGDDLLDTVFSRFCIGK